MMDILDFYTFKYTASTIFSKHSVIHSDKFIQFFENILGY